MTSWVIIRGIKKTGNSYCCPATHTQRANWSAGITFWLLLLLPAPGLWQPEFIFPCWCSFSHLTKPHNYLCWGRSEVFRDYTDKQIKMKGILQGDVCCAFCTFLHRLSGSFHTGQQIGRCYLNKCSVKSQCDLKFCFSSFSLSLKKSSCGRLGSVGFHKLLCTR